MYYKVKALHEQGICIILHVFLYGDKQHINPKETPLAALCQTIYTYPRAFKYNFNSYPYIIATRRHPDLWRNLNADAHPILLEGLHTCGFLPELAAQKRFCMVRTHNIEADYYSYLYKNEKRFFKKIYYAIESYFLRHSEAILKNACAIFSISPSDTAYFEKKYHNVHYLPAFHPNSRVMSQLGRGEYALYHANLSVNENENAALFLINEVYGNNNISATLLPLIIIGKKPSANLVAAAQKSTNILLIANPTEAEMKRIIADAHVHLLPTFQRTGIKLKLLETLFNGRFCLVTPDMVVDTGLEKLCYVADTPSTFRQKLLEIANLSFSETAIQERREILHKAFSNETGAKQIMDICFANNT